MTKPGLEPAKISRSRDLRCLTSRAQKTCLRRAAVCPPRPLTRVYYTQAALPACTHTMAARTPSPFQDEDAHDYADDIADDILVDETTGQPEWAQRAYQPTISAYHRFSHADEGTIVDGKPPGSRFWFPAYIESVDPSRQMLSVTFPHAPGFGKLDFPFTTRALAERGTHVYQSGIPRVDQLVVARKRSHGRWISGYVTHVSDTAVTVQALESGDRLEISIHKVDSWLAPFGASVGERSDRFIRRCYHSLRQLAHQHRTVSRTDRRMGAYTAALAEHGLRLAPQAGDGNCFFRTVAHQLYGDASCHVLIRVAAVAYMACNAAFFSHFVAEEDSTHQQAGSGPGVASQNSPRTDPAGAPDEDSNLAAVSASGESETAPDAAPTVVPGSSSPYMAACAAARLLLRLCDAHAREVIANASATGPMPGQRRPRPEPDNDAPPVDESGALLVAYREQVDDVVRAMQGVPSSALHRYLAAMVKLGTWGDEPELQAVAELYAIPVHVWAVSANHGADIIRRAGQARPAGHAASEPTMHLSFYGGGHYDSIVPARDSEWHGWLRADPGATERQNLVLAWVRLSQLGELPEQAPGVPAPLLAPWMTDGDDVSGARAAAAGANAAVQAARAGAAGFAGMDAALAESLGPEYDLEAGMAQSETTQLQQALRASVVDAEAAQAARTADDELAAALQASAAESGPCSEDAELQTALAASAVDAAPTHESEDALLQAALEQSAMEASSQAAGGAEADPELAAALAASLDYAPSAAGASASGSVHDDDLTPEQLAVYSQCIEAGMPHEEAWNLARCG